MDDQVTIEFREKVIPITKAYEEDGKLYLEGEASGPEIDKDNQFMTPECIMDMADQINKTRVPFRYYDEHNKRGILSDLGELVEAGVSPEFHLKTKVELDQDNPAAVTLWKKVKQGKKFGQSIAGKILGLATKKIGEKMYNGFSKLQLDHVANTTFPSWEWSLGSLVAKSLKQQGLNWDEAPEYEGELELPHTTVYVEKVMKRSKPDPKAGKGYLLIEDLLRHLNTVFDWESYQDKIAEENRDIIPFKDLPLAAKLPVGAVELSADDYDADPEGYIEKMAEMVPEPEQGPMEVRQMAELYERLYFLAESLGRRDEQNGTKDGKKIITKLRAAMKAVAAAMKEMLSKAQPPEPLTYGEEPEPVEKVQEETTMQGDNVLKDFNDAATVGQKPIVPQQPQPSVETGVLTDFSQVADVALPAPQPQPVAKAEQPEDLDPLLGELGEAVKKAWVAEAPVDAKREALAHIVKAFAGELGGRLESQRPEEERIEKAVRQAVAPLAKQIERLQAQLAMVKSQPQAVPQEGGEEPLVRKSVPGGRKNEVILQPARFVEKSDRRPDFVDLVTGQGGLLQ